MKFKEEKVTDSLVLHLAYPSFLSMVEHTVYIESAEILPDHSRPCTICGCSYMVY